MPLADHKDAAPGLQQVYRSPAAIPDFILTMEANKKR